MTQEEIEQTRETIKRGAAVVDGWPEWKRRLIHLFGHPRNIPEQHREQQARDQNQRKETAETAGTERDGYRIDGVMVTAVDTAEFAASLQLP